MKTCRVCLEEKPLAEFYERPEGHDGHRNDCKSCVTLRATAWQRANRERRNERLARWRADNREGLRNYSADWKAEHPERSREIHEEWRQKNPERLADYAHQARLKKYGLTDDAFWDLLERQDFACAICRTPFEAGRLRCMHVDHDHSCCSGDRSCGRCVRGMLCRSCNHGLGLYQDDPDRLFAAIDYLERHAAREDLTAPAAA